MPHRHRANLCQESAFESGIRGNVTVEGSSNRDLEQTKKSHRHAATSRLGIKQRFCLARLECDVVPVVENSPQREKPEKTRLRWPGGRACPLPSDTVD